MLDEQIILNQFRKYEWYRPGLKLLVACSGGLDSTVLLHLLLKLDFEIHVLHFNHKLRGDASDMDEKFVRALAENKGLQVTVISEDIPSLASQEALSIEEAGSIRRNAEYRNTLTSLGYDYAVTAHHLSDQIETILLNLYLGSGIKGLHGISPENNGVIRPLLSTTKNEIKHYSVFHAIRYREDKSNLDLNYLRNRIRNKIIPRKSSKNGTELTSIILKVHRAAIQVNHRIAKSLQIIDNKEIIYRLENKISLGMDRVPNYFSPIKKAIFDNIFQQLTSSSQGLSEKHFNSLVTLSGSKALGKEIYLPMGLNAVRDRKGLTFFKTERIMWKEQKLPSTGSIHFPFFKCQIGETMPAKHLKDPSYFWITEAIEEYTFRKCETGDRLAVEGNRTLSVNQILQEAHVATHLKSLFPILVSKGEVLWVPGVRTSVLAYLDAARLEDKKVKNIKVQFDEGTFE